MTLPSRRTGTPSKGSVTAATLDASNCSGKVIWLKMMLGMGIMNRRKSQGKTAIPKWFQPYTSTTNPPMASRNEKRARKSSAPKTPAVRIPTAANRRTRPDHAGLRGNDASRPLSCQSTNKENAGTKNPWE